uniref:Uncharacterized protein n=2 Tax=viral metagenome TaxID=1070528 RepID=A0A6M3IGN2_9ZZZZ
MGITIGGFANGWQNRPRHELLKEGALYKASDVEYEVLGSVQCRALHREQEYFKTQTFTEAVDNVYIIDVEGNEKYLVYYTVGSTLYCYNSTTKATRTVSSSMVAGAHVSYGPLRPLLSDYTVLHITDGVTMLTDNGTTAKTWGISAPDAPPTAGVGTATGSLTAGVYKFAYSFYDGDTGTESDLSPISVGVTVGANGSVDLTNIKIGPNTRTTARKLYATIADGGTMYFAGTLADNSTTVYTYTQADSNLVLEAVMDQGEPPTIDTVLSYHNVLLLTGDKNYPNRVYTCLPYLPDSYPSTYYIDVGTADSKLVNLVEFNGAVYFISNEGVHRLYGDEQDDFKTDRALTPTGTYARWSVAVGTDGIWYLAHDGVYRFNGDTSERMSDAIGKAFGNSPEQWTDVVDKPSAGKAARGEFLLGTYYLLVPMRDTTGTVQNKIITYDTVLKLWNVLDVDCTHIFADAGRGRLYGCKEVYGSTTDYSVYELVSSDRGGEDSPSPEIVTRSVRLTQAKASLALTKSGSFSQTEEPGVVWMKEFRVDAEGDWTLTFYLDGRLVHTEVLTSLDAGDVYQWRDFPSKLKGRFLYVRAQATGTPLPTTHRLHEVEVR